MRRRILASLIVGNALALAQLAPPALAGAPPSAGHGPLRLAPSAAASASSASFRALCSRPPTRARNVLTSCDQVGSPHNETAVAVNPRDAMNIVASANDYQLNSSAGGIAETVLSRAHVTFDGGQSWTDFAIPYPPECTGTGDPSLAFDADATLYLTTLCGDNGSVLVTHSTDGGVQWAPQTYVYRGSPTLFNDHSTLAAWGHGNVIVTWIPYYFTSSAQTQIVTVPMMTAVSHDRGVHFGPANIVSGSARQCVGLTAPHACDQTWGNAVTPSPTGALLATFFNTTEYAANGSTNLGRNYHFAVPLDPTTGARSAGPYFIGLAYDGITTHDYPVNVDGRQTLQDSQLRLLMQGNIASDPTNPSHFAVVWFDDRSAPHPVSADPYTAVTNSKIIVSQTNDGGLTWTAPAPIREQGDQFFPWAAYDSSGRLSIGYFDRAYDVTNHKYGYTLAIEAHPGVLDFSLTQVTTTMSDPTRDNRWFAVTVDSRFPNATRFLGDYSGIATSIGRVIVVWTDQRLRSCRFGVCGSGQDTFAAVVKVNPLK